MALPKYEGDTGYVRALDDHVVGGADAVKYAMDRFGDEFKTWFNNTFLTSLLATDSENSGADNIGVTPILPNADTVQKTLAALLTQIQSAALGQLPDGTVTDAKLSNAAGQIKGRVVELQNNLTSIQTSVKTVAKIKKDVIIVATAWVDDTANSGFWIYNIADSDITADTVVDVNIHLADLENAGSIKSSNSSSAGKVTLYADESPTENIIADLKLIRQVV